MKLRKWAALVFCATALGVPARADSFTTFFNFTDDSFINAQGATPTGDVVVMGDTMYGTAFAGGSAGRGTVFSIKTNGLGFTILHYFGGGIGGAFPQSGLVLSSNVLYGTTLTGGASDAGTVFAVNTDGSGFTNLHSFTDEYPVASLVVSSNVLYGTAQGGGPLGMGTVFSLGTDGSAFTTLHSFAGFPDEGSFPQAGLVLVGDKLYGATQAGGTNDAGTVFAIKVDGSGFTNLHSFAGSPTEGAYSYTSLTVVGDLLYGTTDSGGISGNGTLFAIKTNGTGFVTIHHFGATSGSLNTNSDGAFPRGGLLYRDGILYGTAVNGGTTGSGTVFQVKTNGEEFVTLHSFTEPSPTGTNVDGAYPRATLALSAGIFYGTTFQGGSSGIGTIFSLFGQAPIVRPELTMKLIGGKAVLSWPTNTLTFTLQAAPEAAGTFTNVGVVTSPYTNTVTGARKFFRLKSN